MSEKVKCPECRGTGKVPTNLSMTFWKDCPTCHGTGFAPTGEGLLTDELREKIEQAFIRDRFHQYPNDAREFADFILSLVGLSPTVKENLTVQPELTAITSMDEFYKKYLPEDDKKYPLTIRVSQEEHDLILNHRGIDWATIEKGGTPS